ncbi:MAG: MarR family winged helix-turn-helix transcriptional regulator [Spirochaetales bacterium]|nr:MarR family winged helix-turn-helix transcriptional regulator [Spirochaetales bacterium]
MNNITGFSQLFERVIHKYNQSENRKLPYGKDLFLTRKEIHTIDAIGRNPDINITGLANFQGVTKGAVSQMIYKLVDKGLVIKHPAPESDAEIRLELTAIGQRAFDIHDNYHKETREEFFNYLGEMPEDDFNKVMEIMMVFEKMVNKKLKK